ncbi:MAG: hypothetical protein H6555_11445 [Lewinellaceae bacterium]|nr:hypothetical protein [Lewinellaceae bacterium]
MSTAEAKSEILELLDQLGERHFPAILEYLKHIKQLTEMDEEAAAHLEKIMEEDDNLLRRLAE